MQLKKGKDIATEIEKLVSASDDKLTKAKKVYDFIKFWYRWNGTYGKYSEFGIKKAFDTKTGNVGDINLSLIAALRFADLDVNPVAGDTLELHDAGGGGYGDPSKRAQALIQKDIDAGLLTAEGARAGYCIKVDDKGRIVTSRPG